MCRGHAWGTWCGLLRGSCTRVLAVTVLCKRDQLLEQRTRCKDVAQAWGVLVTCAIGRCCILVTCTFRRNTWAQLLVASDHGWFAALRSTLAMFMPVACRSLQRAFLCAIRRRRFGANCRVNPVAQRSLQHHAAFLCAFMWQARGLWDRRRCG
jgi:hypothetical protein